MKEREIDTQIFLQFLMALIHLFNWLVFGTTNKNPKFENHSIVAWSTCATTNNVEYYHFDL